MIKVTFPILQILSRVLERPGRISKSVSQNTEKLFTNALTKVFNLEGYYLQTINPLGLKQTKSCLCKREMLNIQGN